MTGWANNWQSQGIKPYLRESEAPPTLLHCLSAPETNAHPQGACRAVSVRAAERKALTFPLTISHNQIENNSGANTHTDMSPNFRGRKFGGKKDYIKWVTPGGGKKAFFVKILGAIIWLI